jgi:hypothetical protein
MALESPRNFVGGFGSNRRRDAPERIGSLDPAKAGFSAYLSHIPGYDRMDPDIGYRTQNPVVREHHVGSSLTSGISQEPIKPSSHGGGQGFESPRLHSENMAFRRKKPELEMRIQTPSGTLVQQPRQD